MRKLTPIEFATIALADLHPAELIGVAVGRMTQLDDPHLAGALRDASHEIARRADDLERLFAEQTSGLPRGQLPRTAHEPASGTWPSGDGTAVVRGPFSKRFSQ